MASALPRSVLLGDGRCDIGSERFWDGHWLADLQIHPGVNRPGAGDLGAVGRSGDDGVADCGGFLQVGEPRGHLQLVVEQGGLPVFNAMAPGIDSKAFSFHAG